MSYRLENEVSLFVLTYLYFYSSIVCTYSTRALVEGLLLTCLIMIFKESLQIHFQY